MKALSGKRKWERERIKVDKESYSMFKSYMRIHIRVTRENVITPQ